MTATTEIRDEIKLTPSLLNSDEIHEALRHEVARSRRSHLPVGLLFLSMHVPQHLQEDPEGWADVVGQIRDRLMGAVRATDHKGRVAADAFVLVLPGLGSASDIRIVADGVMRVLNASFDVDGVQTYIGCSAGAAVLGTSSNSVKGLWQKGGEALLRARALGPGVFDVAPPMPGGKMVGHLRSAAGWSRSRSRRVSDDVPWTGPRAQRIAG